MPRDSLQFRLPLLRIPLPLQLLQIRPLDLPTNSLGQETRIHKLDLPRILVGRCIFLAESLQVLDQFVAFGG